MSSNESSTSEGLSAQSIFSGVAVSSAAGIITWGVVAFTYGVLNDPIALGEWGDETLPRLVLLGSGALAVMGYVLSLRHKLTAMMSEIPAYLFSIAILMGGWWILFRSGAPGDSPFQLTLEESSLVMGGSALLMLLGVLLVDNVRFARSVWLSLASTFITVLCGGTLFMVLRPAFLHLVGLVDGPVFVAHGFAGAAAGFVAVRIGRNLLFGVEDEFLNPSALYMVGGVVLFLSGTVGVSLVNGTGVPLVIVLAFSGGAALVWFVLAVLLQRPSAFREVETLD